MHCIREPRGCGARNHHIFSDPSLGAGDLIQTGGSQEMNAENSEKDQQQHSRKVSRTQRVRQTPAKAKREKKKKKRGGCELNGTIWL